jgi:hypothetical protein
MYLDIKICLDISTLAISNSDRREYLIIKYSSVSAHKSFLTELPATGLHFSSRQMWCLAFIQIKCGASLSLSHLMGHGLTFSFLLGTD